MQTDWEEIDWKEELRKVKLSRIGIVLAASAFLVGIVMGTQEEGMSLGIFYGFMFTFSLAASLVFLSAVFVVLSMFAIWALQTITELIQRFPTAQEWILKILRWLQGY